MPTSSPAARLHQCAHHAHVHQLMGFTKILSCWGSHDGDYDGRRCSGDDGDDHPWVLRRNKDEQCNHDAYTNLPSLSNERVRARRMCSCDHGGHDGLRHSGATAETPLHQGRGRTEGADSFRVLTKPPKANWTEVRRSGSELPVWRMKAAALWSAMGKNDGVRWIVMARGEASGSRRGARAGRRFVQGLLGGGAVEAVNLRRRWGSMAAELRAEKSEGRLVAR